MSLTDRLRRRLGMRGAATVPDLPESALAMVLRLDGQGLLVGVPAGFAALLGETSESLRGRSLVSLAHIDDAPALLNQMQLLRAGEQALIEHETRLRRGEGVVHVALAAAKSRAPDGEGMVVTVADVSARRVAEEQLETSQLLLREALDALPDHLAILDGHGCIIATNRAWNRFTAEHRLGGPTHGVGSTYLRVHEGLGGQDAVHAQAAANGLRGVLDGTNTEFTLEYPFGPDRRRWFLLRATRMGGTGQARCVVAHQDVSDRRRAAAALSDSEARYRTLCESAAVGIWQVGLDGRTHYLNPAMCALLEVDSRMDLGAETFHGFFTAEGLAVMEEQHAERASGGRSVYEVELLGRRGAQRQVAVTGAPIQTLEGRLSGYLGTFTDITAQHRQAQVLQEAQKLDALGRLAGGVAHELSNLLTVVLGRCDRLAATSGGADLDAVVTATEQAAMLTRQLLAFSRRQVLSIQPRNLNHLIRELNELLVRVLDQGIHLQIHLDAELGEALVDQARLEQGLVALASRARAAMPAGGMVTLTTANVVLTAATAPTGLAPGDFVSLTITDTGLPLDDEARTRLFEPLTSTGPDGGLSALWGLVAQLGGHLAVHPLAIGSRFTVLLPRCHTPAVRPSALGRRVVLAEDEPALRCLVAEVLRAEGWTVIEAADGTEAERLAICNAPDLLVTDLVMRLVSGRDLATRLRAHLPNLPILFMSGYNPDGWLAGSEPHTAFLAKPFTLKELCAAVEALVRV